MLWQPMPGPYNRRKSNYKLLLTIQPQLLHMNSNFIDFNEFQAETSAQPDGSELEP